MIPEDRVIVTDILVAAAAVSPGGSTDLGRGVSWSSTRETGTAVPPWSRRGVTQIRDTPTGPELRMRPDMGGQKTSELQGEPTPYRGLFVVKRLFQTFCRPAPRPSNA